MPTSKQSLTKFSSRGPAWGLLCRRTGHLALSHLLPQDLGSLLSLPTGLHWVKDSQLVQGKQHQVKESAPIVLLLKQRASLELEWEREGKKWVSTGIDPQPYFKQWPYPHLLNLCKALLVLFTLQKLNLFASLCACIPAVQWPMTFLPAYCFVFLFCHWFMETCTPMEMFGQYRCWIV